MTRSRYKFFENEYPYFMTCTINSWLPIFTRQESADIILDSWRYLQKERGLKLFAYVILENHLHMIASAPDISATIQSFKSYTARQIIDLLKSRGSETLLRQLSATKLNHKTESTYQVWQEGSHPQQIQSDDMMWQKIEYIHNNPVLRGFVDDPLHWRWSSARNYAKQPGLIEVVTDWM
jgi:putative transposase